MPITRRHLIVSAAATAAVAAMLAASTIAAVEVAPFNMDSFIALCVAETERRHPSVNSNAIELEYA